jgi:hypothetical protein
MFVVCCLLFGVKQQTTNNKQQTTNKHFEQIEPLKPFEQNPLKTQRPFQKTLLRRTNLKPLNQRSVLNQTPNTKQTF